MNTFTIICAAIIYAAFTCAICYLAYRIGELSTHVKNLKEEFRLKSDAICDLTYRNEDLVTRVKNMETMIRLKCEKRHVIHHHKE